MIEKRFAVLYQVGNESNPRVSFPKTKEQAQGLQQRMIAADVTQASAIIEILPPTEQDKASAFILRKLDNEGNTSYVSRVCSSASDMAMAATNARKKLQQGETVRPVGVRVLMV